MKQSAVEWLEDCFNRYGAVLKSDFIKAKEMEKQQIIDARVTAPLLNTCSKDEYIIEAEQYYKETFKNKEEPIQEILENLENQLKKVIKEHTIDVNEDTYWRGVKIGLETAIEVIKFKNK